MNKRAIKFLTLFVQKFGFSSPSFQFYNKIKMQNILKTIFVSLFIALGAFAFSMRTNANFNAENSVSVNNKIAEKSNDATAPKDLFLHNCARCHGADGAGQTEIGQKMDVPDLSISGRRMSIGKISRIIANGRDEMPSFAKKLNKKQIASIAAYVRKL